MHQLLWETTWDNYFLLLGSIDEGDPVEDKPQLEVKDAVDIF